MHGEPHVQEVDDIFSAESLKTGACTQPVTSEDDNDYDKSSNDVPNEQTYSLSMVESLSISRVDKKDSFVPVPYKKRNSSKRASHKRHILSFSYVG
tara:strand:- start:341 stop:628 length:288 start_codon:yes stop_codon:yes gene_type:complete